MVPTTAKPPPLGIVATIVIALLGALAVVGWNALQMRLLADKQWNDLQARGTLRIGIDPGWQPFSFYSDRGWDGIDAEVGREIARRLHLQVETIPVGYDSLYDALHLWQVDILLSAVVVDPARTADYAYTRPYFDAGLRIVSLRTKQVSSVDDMAGLRIAAVLGTDADRALRYWERRLPAVKRLETKDIQSAIDLLVAGGVDAVVMDALETMTTATQTNAITSVALTHQPYLHAEPPEQYAIALRRDNSLLLMQLDQTLAEMQTDGTLQKIMSHWSSN